MEIQDLALEGLKLIKSKVFYDERGFFKEHYRKSAYEKKGIFCEFVQDNHSFSKKGIIRGMHFQRSPGQAKLISVVEGKIYDVAVDIRPESTTYGKWEGVYLDAEDHLQFFVPVGFAHGFCVVSERAHVIYKVSSVFNPEEEKTFRFDDAQIGIKWPVENPILSSRDCAAPSFQEVFS
ncbi:MAG TPA: dTDP-4-dehydrorhamnose 3,5-epimerase [Rhabdochlamydiaceae bacterium]|nr:dTDP-4-dehydrorhamnose 3,5-epimerase [Rhabdochlamydiaceae bacterium]